MALLPDPDPRQRQHVVISVDDHVIEPPDMFVGRLPAALSDRAPKVVESDDGRQVWRYEDREYPNIGLNAVIGRPHEEWSMEAARFDEMRRGCWDIDARIADMDLAGIWASLNFPSLIAGFAGTVFWKSDDLELGLATLRAWNDWHLEVWAGSYPERIIPLQLPWLADPQLAPGEIRRNAARGFKAVSFPGAAGPMRNPEPAQRRVGTVLRRLRGDRHRRVPAHRFRAVGANSRPGHPV
jgi:hypothetical protein